MDTSTENDTIVVGIDGSPSSERALAWAARQAALEHRALTLVHACGPLYPTWVGPATLDLEALRESTARYAATIATSATRWVAEHHPDVVVHTALTETDARQELLDRSSSAAMVVLGSRGRGPVGTLLLGSVSTAVSSHASCPVVVVRPRDEAETSARTGVLVGVQETEWSRPVLEHAFRLASTRSLALTVLQCLWDARFDGAPEPTTTTSPEVTEHRSALAEVVAEMGAKFPDVAVTTKQQHGFLDRLLIDLSPTVDAVVLGSHHPSLLRRAVYGSLARTVLEHADGVVVVVPLLDEVENPRP